MPLQQRERLQIEFEASSRAHAGTRPVWQRAIQFRREVCQAALEGNWESLLAILSFAGGVLCSLFLTVHRRNPAYYDFLLKRFRQVVMVWIQHGYLRHGGLAFQQPGEADPTQKVWPYPMGFLQGAHILERIYYALTGRYSQMLMLLHNQFIILISASLLGLLAMRFVLRLGVNRNYALLFGFACTAVYQTFPPNLFCYWEITSMAGATLCMLAFLVLDDVIYERGCSTRLLSIARALSVFGMFHSEPIYGALFTTTFVFATYLLRSTHVRLYSPLRTIALPASLSVAILTLQVSWVRHHFPNVRDGGSGFLYRTGLDGSIEYYSNHWDMIAHRLAFPEHMLASLVQPWFLLIGGSVALIAVLIFFLTMRLPHAGRAFLALTVTTGTYLVYMFLFSQAAVIHPYEYDVYLAVPLVLALFAMLPACLERLTRNSGIVTFATLILAFCYAMVQLRSYSVAFPMR